MPLAWQGFAIFAALSILEDLPIEASMKFGISLIRIFVKFLPSNRFSKSIS